MADQPTPAGSGTAISSIAKWLCVYDHTTMPVESRHGAAASLIEALAAAGYRIAGPREVTVSREMRRDAVSIVTRLLRDWTEDEPEPWVMGEAEARSIVLAIAAASEPAE